MQVTFTSPTMAFSTAEKNKEKTRGRSLWGRDSFNLRHGGNLPNPPGVRTKKGLRQMPQRLEEKKKDKN